MLFALIACSKVREPQDTAVDRLQEIPLIAGPKAREPHEPPVPARAILKEEWRRVYGAFRDLSGDGRLYVGKVESVKMLRREPDFLSLDEYGEFSFRVERAVRGPFKEHLSLGYHVTEFSNPQKFNNPHLELVLVSDSGLPGNWVRRPKEGDELLLLLLPSRPGSVEPREWIDDGWVAYVWEGVGPDHPLVKDFEVASRYLDAREESVQHVLFRKLCRSAWPSIRQFAEHAVFWDREYVPRSDWLHESKLLGEYVKRAGPILTDWERVEFTHSLTFALCGYGEEPPRRNPCKAPAEWSATLKDWYLQELGSDTKREDPQRTGQVLIELRVLLRAYGIADTLSLFKNHGFSGLDKKLQATAQSTDPFVRENAEELLRILRAKRKILRPVRKQDQQEAFFTTTEGDNVSLQVLIPDVVLHRDRSYDAKNLPPGLTIDRLTGTISGRIDRGASVKSPYKVLLNQHSKTRQCNSTYLERTLVLSWIVNPTFDGREP